MQTRPIAQLAARLRSKYRICKSWTKAAQQLHVLGPDADPSRGLAFQIAINGYMPTDLVIRRLIFDGAIPPPPRVPLNLDRKICRAIINAMKKREPLPDPDARTTREFNRWLIRPRLTRGPRVAA